MKRVSVLLLILTLACSHAITAVDRAEAVYGQTAIAYSTAQSSIVVLRQNHLVSDAQWTEFDHAQHAVAAFAPLVSASLRVWKSTGTKPNDFDLQLANLLNAFTRVVALYEKMK